MSARSSGFVAFGARARGEAKLDTHLETIEVQEVLPHDLAGATHRLWSGRHRREALALLYGGCVDQVAAALQLPVEQEGELPAVRSLTRRVPHDWWVYSFTQLAHADAGAGSSVAADEPAGAELPLEPALPEPAAADAAPLDPRFMGSRFGNVLHEALENVDFAAWGGWRPDRPAPEGQADLLRKALHDEGYADEDLDDGVAVLVPLVGHTLTVALPEGGALHSLGEGERRAEIEFHFAIEPTAVPALLQLLHAHGISSARRGFGLRRRLEGLMTGKIDLTYVRDGRWYVLDYKSNRLPGYSPDLLQIAMRHSEYDLQALIYTVALHRWLRFRLGRAYDYARDMGGIRYLFCRGLDGNGNGVHVDRFAPELVDGLDALFAGGDAAHADLVARALGASA